MPTYTILKVYCPSCGKWIGTNIDAVGNIELFCRNCKEAKVIKLNPN